MSELTSFPINTSLITDLDPITDAQANDADQILFYDASVSVMKRMSRGELSKGKVIPLDNISVFSGLDTDSFDDRQQFHLNSFAPDGATGGGPLLWSPTLPKSLHDGVRYFSPTVPVPADFDNPTDVQNYMDGVGEEWPAGDGVFVLTLFSIQSSESPAVDGAIVLFDGVSGNTVKNGPVPSTLGNSKITVASVGAVSYERANADNTVTMRSTADHKSDLSIDNVDNTSDAQKVASGPIFDALSLKADTDYVDDELELKAPLASPALTGTPTVPTAPADTNTTQAASTAYVQGEIADRVQSVATIADLRLMTGLQTGQKLSLVEYASGTGKGRGNLTVVSETTSADNDGTIFVTADGKRVYRDDWDNISTEDFGMVNGTSDQSAVFQKAVTWAETNSKPLRAPKNSSYYVGGITSGTVDFVTDGCTLNLHASYTNIWLMDDAEDPEIKKVSFVDPAARSSVYGFRATNTTGLRMRACNVYGWADRCMFFEQSCSDIKVIGGQVYDCTGADVYCAKCPDVDFVRVGFKDCEQHVIRYGAFGADSGEIFASGTVDKCVFRNIQNDPILCELNAQDVIVTSCKAYNCRDLIKSDGSETPPEGFFIPKRVSVINPIVVGTNSTLAAPVAAINLIKTPNCTVQGGTLDGGGTGTHGVSVGPGSTVTGLAGITGYVNGVICYGSYCTITGNAKIDVTGDGIRSGGTGDLSYSTVSGNAVEASNRGISLAGSIQTILNGNITVATTNGIRTTSDCDNLTIVNNRNAGGAANSLGGTSLTTANNT